MKELPPEFRDIPSGVELVEHLTEVFANHRGWLQAVGFVEDVELRLAGSGADVSQVFRGRFALAQLSGPLGGPYGATLSRIEGERAEVIAGVLLRAVSAEVSALCLSAPVPTAAERAAPPRAAASPEAAAVPAPTVPLPSGSSFAARVGVTPRPVEEEREPIQELPERADLVEHFAFGLCEVLKAEGDRLVLRDLRHGRIREIASEKLSISGPVEHDGKRLFKLSRR